MNEYRCGGRRVTYRDQEQNAGHHTRKPRPFTVLRPYAAHDTYGESPNSRNYIRMVKDIMRSDFVGGVSRTRDDDHHEQVDPAPPVVEGLEIRKRGNPGEYGYDDKLGPGGKRA